KSLFIGRFQPPEFAQVFDAGSFESEDNFGEVEALDFGQFLLWAMAVFFTGPQAHTYAGCRTTGTASALVGGGLADFFNQQRVDAPIRIVARYASQSAVDDAADAIDGQ